MTVAILAFRLLAEAGVLAGPLLVSLFRPRPAQPESALTRPASGLAQRTRRVPLVANLLAILMFFLRVRSRQVEVVRI